MAQGNSKPPIHLAGARNLGKQQMALADVRLVPSMNISIVEEIGGVRFLSPMLAVIDLSTNKAMVTPIDSRWLRQEAVVFTALADKLDERAGVGSGDLQPIGRGEHGGAAVHE